MAKFLIALFLVGAVAAGFLIYTKKENISVLPKTPAERWVDSLPEDQASCVKEKVGLQYLNDIQGGKVEDTDIRAVVNNADCGVVWNDESQP